MKRVLCFLLAVVLCAAVCACNKSTETTWQEQYDLGMRYLSDGKYEEAVLAFAAAIEIDPKRPEAYSGLADAYVRLGNMEQAQEVLRQGLAAVGENQELSDKLAELDGAANDLAEEGAVNAYGATSFSRRRNYRSFDSMTSEQQAVVEAAANAAIAQDPEALGQTLEASKAFESREDGVHDVYLRTFWNGYKIELNFYEKERGPDSGYLSNTINRWVHAELRPENGEGYSLSYNDKVPTAAGACDATSCEIAVGTCADWQWNGAVVIVATDKGTVSYSGGSSGQQDIRCEEHGTMKDNLRDGLFTFILSGTRDGEAMDETSTELYQDGRMVEDPWTEDGRFVVLTGAAYSEEEMDAGMRDYLFW